MRPYGVHDGTGRAGDCPAGFDLYDVKIVRIRLFHWKAAEAEPLLVQLKGAGHTVEYSQEIGSYWPNRRIAPDVFVIDLTRAPAHGREVAVALRGYKATRQVPIVFVDGEPEKVDEVKRVIPDGIYTSRLRLLGAIRHAKPVNNPFVPTQMMDRFAHRSAAQKMGIGKDMRVAIIDPPADYARVIGELPEGAWLDEQDSTDCKVTLWFVHDHGAFEAALPRMRRVAETSRLWILWRKSKQDGIDGNTVRRSAIQVGLVDYKICSVNQTWTGMVFAVKKAGQKTG